MRPVIPPKEAALRVYQFLLQPRYADTLNLGVALAQSIYIHETPAEEHLLIFAEEVKAILNTDVGSDLWGVDAHAFPEFLSELNILLLQDPPLSSTSQEESS